MNYWIRAYDGRQYRVDDFIRDHGFIDWPMRNHFEVGDVVFLYLTAPVGRITWAMEVTKVDMTWQECEADDEYFMTAEAMARHIATRDSKRYVRFGMLKQLTSPMLSLAQLRAHGMNGAPRSPRRLQPDTVEFVLAHMR